MNKMLEWARFYVSKGISVIPLSPKSKVPSNNKLPIKKDDQGNPVLKDNGEPERTWTPFTQRFPADEELEAWFDKGSNDNIAIVTGKLSGITGVDLDGKEACDFAEEHNFPLTPTVKTGKGFHLYYRNKEGTRNFQKRDDLPGIDLRSEGGYVVAPPSIHPSGVQYEWVEGKSLDDLPLAELPEIILAKSPEHKTPLKELYQGVPEGMRNDSLTRIIGSLVNDGLSLEECLSLALAWNEKNNPPETDSRKIERTVQSIFEKHHRELSELSHMGGGQLDNSIPEPFSYLKKGSDLRQLDISIEWIVDKLLPKESVTLLHGRGGIGKTWISLILADAISRGLPFMGLDCQKIDCIFIDFENSLPVLIDRIRKANIDEVFFWHNTNEVLKPPRLDSEPWNLYKTLPSSSLLIYDTLRASQSRDENDSQHMAFIMQRLKELRDKGFTILLLHHTPKGNDRTYKGSTAILDLADHVLSLHKVRKNNPEGGEIEDEDEQDCLYRLGMRGKTRYEPFHIFMAFDKTKGFVKALDPDTEDLEAIQDILKERGILNQGQIFDAVKEELDIKSKGKLVNLLKKGEGKFWKSRKEGRAFYYEALSTVQLSAPYIPQNGQINSSPEELSKKSRTDSPSDTPQTVDSSQVSKCPDSSQTIETDEVIEVLEVSE